MRPCPRLPNLRQPLSVNGIICFVRGACGRCCCLPGLEMRCAYKAVVNALEGDTKRKYFEHAGALLTADTPPTAPTTTCGCN